MPGDMGEGAGTWQLKAIPVLASSRGCFPLQREQVKALVSRCVAVLQNVPSKLQSCLQERDEAQQRADEALRAKAEVTGQPMGCSGASSLCSPRVPSC